MPFFPNMKICYLKSLDSVLWKLSAFTHTKNAPKEAIKQIYDNNDNRYLQLVLVGPLFQST